MAKSNVLESDLIVPPGETLTYDVSDYSTAMYSAVMNKATGYVHYKVSRAVSASGAYVEIAAVTLTNDTPTGEVVDLRGVNSLKFVVQSVSGSETVTLNVSAWS